MSVRDEKVKSERVKVKAIRLEDGVAITAPDISALTYAEERLLRLAT